MTKEEAFSLAKKAGIRECTPCGRTLSVTVDELVTFAGLVEISTRLKDADHFDSVAEADATADKAFWMMTIASELRARAKAKT